MDLYNRGFVDTSDLFQAQQETGLSQHDFRLKESLRVLMKLGNRTLDFDAFRSVIRPAILLVEQVLQGQMVVPDFTRLTQPIDDIYGRVQQMRSGEVASYISQLARVPPEQFGVSLCTIDGQIKSWGDADVDFCLQSTCKPINYCLALEEQGEEKVHQHVGREPSGVSFNELTLAENNRPHNPMINAGAIMCCSLIRPDADMSERFDYVLDRWAALCGGNRPRYNNAVYLSERATADRNFALGYFMKEKKAFPEGTNLIDTLEFYFQCCAIEFNCKDMALVAATLANGGVCPASGMRVLKSQTVQNALSLMYSCGMYDFSGEFAFSVGLPAKSGVAGALLVVVPNVMGLCIWSPRLDKHGNSVRGVAFCQQLVETFNFHNYDNLTGLTDKIDPRVDGVEVQANRVQEIIWAASKGDLSALQRYAMRGDDLSGIDYDNRTPLHLAAVEGQTEVVRWLLEREVDASPLDRWGRTPSDDALMFGQEAALEVLAAFGGKHGPSTALKTPPNQPPGRPSASDKGHGYQMIWAAAVGDMAAMRRLIARGVLPNDTDYDSRTALHLAAAEGHIEVVKVLLAQGGRVHVRDRWGATPIDDARLHGHAEIVSLLESASADAA
ncbi:MAG: glutaminase A [Myxococcota bacterium]